MQRRVLSPVLPFILLFECSGFGLFRSRALPIWRPTDLQGPPAPLTFEDHLHKVLSGQLILAHKALVRAPVTFDHVIHDKVFVVGPCDPHIFSRVEDFTVSVPGQFLVLTSCHAAGQGNLATHAALNFPGADGSFQWLWRFWVRENREGKKITRVDSISTTRWALDKASPSP